MPGIVSFIQKIIESLFGGSSPEAERRRALRSIGLRLKTHRPSYYDPSSGEVLPGFATVLLRLAKAAGTVSHILDRSILCEDTHFRHRFLDYLIEAHMPEDLLRLRRSFCYDDMRRRVHGTADQVSAMRRLESDMEELCARLSATDFSHLEDGLYQLQRLGHLCRFGFQNMLHPFVARVDTSGSVRSSSLQPVSGRVVLNDLMDLAFLTSDLRVDSSVVEYVQLLLERILGEKAKGHRDRMRKTLLWIKGAIERYLPGAVLTDLIRVIRQDPAFVPQHDRDDGDFMGDYVDRVHAKFDRDMARIRREADESLIAMDLSILFKKKELVRVEGYNEENNSTMVRNDLRGFSQTVPLQIVKSFLVLRFDEDYKPVIKRILVDGYFDDKMFQNSLSGALYECETALQTIKDFESEVNGRGKTSVSEIKRLLGLHRQGKAALSALTGLVDSIDDRAKEMIERMTNSFYRLYSLLAELMNDLKARTPTIISNIKVLAGSKNNELIKRMVDMHNDLDKFLEIMKKFTFVGTTPVAAQKKEE